MPTADAINPRTAAFLLSSSGQAAVNALGDELLDDSRALQRLEQLRRTWPAAEAGAILALARLRQRARAKFTHAAELFFTAQALEQATAEPVADHRAAAIDAAAPPGPVLDLGCGVGGDLLALAQRRPVIGYEMDPVCAQFARANAAAARVPHPVQVIEGDWTEILCDGLPAAAAVFADPARRRNGRRIMHLEEMEPPLARLLALASRAPLLVIKVMPGIDSAHLPANCSVEFVSHAGVCKEAVLWFGRAAPVGREGARWATVITPGAVHELPTDADAPPVGPLAAGQVLYEPDPAVIRAGCLGRICARTGGHLFEPSIAYVVADTHRAEPLAQAFAVDEVHPFQLKRLNERLHALGIGQVEIKKRGFPLAPEDLRPRLRLIPGGRPAVILLTRRANQHWMIIGRRLPGAAAGASPGDETA